jgi:hypothetical protein
MSALTFTVTRGTAAFWLPTAHSGHWSAPALASPDGAVTISHYECSSAMQSVAAKESKELNGSLLVFWESTQS